MNTCLKAAHSVDVLRYKQMLPSVSRIQHMMHEAQQVTHGDQKVSGEEGSYEAWKEERVWLTEVPPQRPPYETTDTIYM